MNFVRFVILVVATLAGNASAIEIPLGTRQLPCATAQWGSKGPYGFSTPQRTQRSQTVNIKLIVEGDNINSPATMPHLRTCATETANSVDLQFLAREPAEGNKLFRKLFFECVRARGVQTRLHFAALKLEGYCGRD
jgi:hypothetical protein